MADDDRERIPVYPGRVLVSPYHKDSFQASVDLEEEALANLGKSGYFPVKGSTYGPDGRVIVLGTKHDDRAHVIFHADMENKTMTRQVIAFARKEEDARAVIRLVEENLESGLKEQGVEPNYREVLNTQPAQSK